jgi:hypothetical protein
MDESIKTYSRSIEGWWAERSRPQKVAIAGAALVFGGLTISVLLRELAVAAAGGALTAGAAWVVRKGLVG